jgi:hypothetical protein
VTRAVGVVVVVDVDDRVGDGSAVEVGVELGLAVAVNNSVGVKDGLADMVGEAGRRVRVAVAEAMKAGVGERIAGNGEGETSGVELIRAIFQLPQPASKSANRIAGKVLFIFLLPLLL